MTEYSAETRVEPPVTDTANSVSTILPPREARRDGRLTIIVPAFNEERLIADTILSLRSQTQPPDRIVVIDDCSTDRTAEIARLHGADVVRPPRNSGSKAGAQSYALDQIDSEYVMAIDADTILAPDAVEKIMPAIRVQGVGAACGFVIPRHVDTVWERGRYLEYLITLGFFKVVQDHYQRPMISSGCFSVYRTDILKSVGGWSTRTLAEDMDLTWTLYEHGYHVRFVKEAMSFPVEPHDFGFMSKQLRRWSHGFMQNVRLHWRHVVRDRFLSLIVAVATFDSILAPIVYLFAMPLLMLTVSPWYGVGYVFDLPIVAVPILTEAATRGEFFKAVACLPAFLVLRQVNSVFMLTAFWNEFVLRRSFRVFEKGH